MNCLLCKREVQSISSDRYKHPPAEDCLVKFTDGFGVAVEAAEDSKDVPESFEDFEADLVLFPVVDKVLKEIFRKRGLTRLGGASSGRGWSSFSRYQQCPYLWFRTYVEPLPPTLFPEVEPVARAIGTLVHTFLAIFYTRMINPTYPLTPELVRDELLLKADPEVVNEAWRVFVNYALYYQDENIMPLAIEMDLVHPRTGESCRYDLVAFFPEDHGDRVAGTYNVEHKSIHRFDDTTLNGWANEGEVLGQMMLWEDLGLHHRYGPLKGTIINLLGKQKEPKLHRTTVAPSSFAIEQHRQDLKIWEAQIQLAVASKLFPRARSGCINRYGRCSLYDHCATGGL